MENKILLSICIPTYNRAHYLKNCLDAISCQFQNKKIYDQVEIVISDNASEDDTQKLVKKYQKKFKNINYFKNKKNLGPDDNLINSVLKANGKYCWHIGDDDLIRNGSLNFLINFLQKNELAILTFLAEPIVDIKKILQKQTNIKSEHILFCDSYEKFYKKVYCHGLLGIFIFNKNLWLKVDRRNYEKYWAYYEIILKMLTLSNLKLAHLNYPILFTGQDYAWNKNGTALFVLIHQKRILPKLINFGYSKKLIENQLKKTAKELVKTLLIAKKNNLRYSFSNLRLIYKEFYKYPFHLFCATIVFFIPNFFIKFLVALKKTN